jgi:maltose/moltooligosaccharide transporter
MANPALTEHVFKTPAPIESHYDLSSSEGLAAFDTDNTNFQESSNAVGSAMGVYGLSSMAFALLFTFYTSKRTINRKYVHMGSLTLGGIGFLAMYIATPDYAEFLRRLGHYQARDLPLINMPPIMPMVPI